jgi:hypothetical protein
MTWLFHDSAKEYGMEECCSDSNGNPSTSSESWVIGTVTLPIGGTSKHGDDRPGPTRLLYPVLSILLTTYLPELVLTLRCRSGYELLS